MSNLRHSVVAIVRGGMMRALSSPVEKVTPPYDELIGRYKKLVAPLACLEWARHRQGHGAARNKQARYIDRQGYVNRGEQNASDWNGTAPHNTVIYPASRFKKEEPVMREIRCKACDRLFEAKRKDAAYCGAACRKWAERNRK